ncbi:hypothetical protein [Proteus faecis]
MKLITPVLEPVTGVTASSAIEANDTIAAAKTEAIANSVNFI